LHVHLDGWSIGCFAHPEIKIHSLASFEKDRIVAVIQFCQFVQLVELRFCVQLRILPAVRQQRHKVIEEMAMSAIVSL